MAQPWRIEYAGGCYHVINRGNYRQDLFADESAAEAFERVLDEAARRYGWRIHAYVVMRNHFHLAIELGEPNLGEGMKWLQGTWVRRFNRFRGWNDRPFEGRYKALVAEPGAGLARVCHYIYPHPLRAGSVPSERVSDYRWSSLPKFACQRSAVMDETVGLNFRTLLILKFFQRIHENKHRYSNESC